MMVSTFFAFVDDLTVGRGPWLRLVCELEGVFGSQRLNLDQKLTFTIHFHNNL